MSIKSIRLTDSKRASIIESVMQAWEVLNPKPLKNEAQEKCVNYYYDKAYQGEVGKVLNDPKFNIFFHKGTHFLVQVEGTMVTFSFNIARPLPKASGSYPCIYVTDEKPQVHKDWEKAVEDYANWTTEFSTLKREVTELLKTCATTKELIDLWPEIEPLLPAYLADPSKGVKLPAIPVSRLNERLGLTS